MIDIDMNTNRRWLPLEPVGETPMMDRDSTRATLCVIIFTKRGMRQFIDAVNAKDLVAEDFQGWVSARVSRRYFQSQLARLSETDAPLVLNSCTSDELLHQMTEAKASAKAGRLLFRANLGTRAMAAISQTLVKNFGAQFENVHRHADWLCFGAPDLVKADRLPEDIAFSLRVN